MQEHLYLFFPMFANGMVALSLMFKLYRRSVSTLMMFLAVAISSNLMYYGFIDEGILSMLVFMVVTLARAMAKSSSDRFFHHRYRRRRSTDFR